MAVSTPSIGQRIAWKTGRKLATTQSRPALDPVLERDRRLVERVQDVEVCSWAGAAFDSQSGVAGSGVAAGRAAPRIRGCIARRRPEERPPWFRRPRSASAMRHRRRRRRPAAARRQAARSYRRPSTVIGLGDLVAFGQSGFRHLAVSLESAPAGPCARRRRDSVRSRRPRAGRTGPRATASMTSPIWRSACSGSMPGRKARVHLRLAALHLRARGEPRRRRPGSAASRRPRRRSRGRPSADPLAARRAGCPRGRSIVTWLFAAMSPAVRTLATSTPRKNDARSRSAGLFRISSGVPTWTTRPPSMMAMRSPMRMASSRSCEMKMMVRLCLLLQRRAARPASRCGSAGRARRTPRPSAGSSGRWPARGRGRRAAACRPRARWDSSARRRARPTCSSAARARFSRCARGTPDSSRPKAAFCRTVRCGISAKDWNTMEMCSRRKSMQLLLAHRRDVGAVDDDLAGGGLDQPVEHPHQRRLARARQAHDDEDLALAARRTWRRRRRSSCRSWRRSRPCPAPRGTARSPRRDRVRTP